MSYLLDKKIQRNKSYKIALVVAFLIVLFYFRVGIWKGLSKVSAVIFHPALVVGYGVGGKLQNIGSYFISKNSLYNENQKLQGEVAFDDARMANYDSIVSDDVTLKETLGRINPKTTMTVATILSKPNQSPYDTLLIDAGTNQGVKTGDAVFALGDVPIGSVSDVSSSSATVILFSNPGTTTQVIIPSAVSALNASATAVPTTAGGNVATQIVGRGGGNFEIVIPKGSVLQEGAQAVLPGINAYVVGIVQKVISDPRNAFTKVLLTSPVNIQQLKFVEVEQ